MGALNSWYQMLAAREQRAVCIGGVAGAVLLLLAVLVPFERHVAAASQRVQTKQADLAWLHSMGPQLAALAATNAGDGTGSSGESLVALADRVARESGIARSLTSLPSGDGALSVRLEKVPFDSLVHWVGTLVHQHGITVVSASIDGGAAAGIVGATFVLRQR